MKYYTLYNSYVLTDKDINYCFGLDCRYVGTNPELFLHSPTTVGVISILSDGYNNEIAIQTADDVFKKYNTNLEYSTLVERFLPRALKVFRREFAVPTNEKLVQTIFIYLPEHNLFNIMKG